MIVADLKMNSKVDETPGLFARPASTRFMVLLTHDVWFRWFKGKLSRMKEPTRFASICISEFRSKLSETDPWQIGSIGVSKSALRRSAPESLHQLALRSAGSVSSAAVIAGNSETLSSR